MNKELETIKKRIKKEKELLLEQLKKTPIVQIACEKVGIGRTTYYRWRQTDGKFRAMADVAIAEGISLVNDMAESQLMASIRDGNMAGIIFWLKNHHAAYNTTRIEIKNGDSEGNEKLTKKQEKIIEQMISVAQFKKILKMSKEEGNEE